MKCHYEVLQVDLDASDDDIRKSYRKLALRWHPDKNLSNSEEAKEQFQLIQQAYEVLSDPQERSWYDRHRDSILKGGLGSDYKDDSLNVYQYFNTSCFKGFGDDDKGFYAVYSEVFNKIGAEDSEYYSSADSDFEIPVFGDSSSSYEDVVHPFYSYWQSYSTKKSYSWLDKYDTRNAPSRRVLRLMEKENKKIRDKARKERNDEVRALVAFVRRRDKRVQEYSLYLERKAVENDKKMQEFRKKQIIKRKEEMSSYVECDWAKFSNLEGELKEIEANVAAEFADSEAESHSTNSDVDSSIPHCLACNKIFKTDKALLNHENSKKHKENLERLSEIMKELDAKANGMFENTSELSAEESYATNSKVVNQQEDKFASDEEHLPKPRKKKKKKVNLKLPESLESNELNDDNGEICIKVTESSDEDEFWKKNKVKNKADNKKKQKSSVRQSGNDLEGDKDISSASRKLCGKEHKCAVCNNTFSSKNDLFRHLKSTGHAVPLSEKVNSEHLKSSKQKRNK